MDRLGANGRPLTTDLKACASKGVGLFFFHDLRFTIIRNGSRSDEKIAGSRSHKFVYVGLN